MKKATFKSTKVLRDIFSEIRRLLETIRPSDPFSKERFQDAKSKISYLLEEGWQSGKLKRWKPLEMLQEAIETPRSLTLLFLAHHVIGFDLSPTTVEGGDPETKCSWQELSSGTFHQDGILVDHLVSGESDLWLRHGDQIISKYLIALEEIESALVGDPEELFNKNATPKRGRRPKADLKRRSNRELLIAILLKHHRYESKNGLNLDPISTEEACNQLGKSLATLSKTWKEIQPTLTYANYVKLCGRYKSLEKLLKAIDSKEGYLERSNKEEAIDNSEG